MKRSQPIHIRYSSPNQPYHSQIIQVEQVNNTKFSNQIRQTFLKKSSSHQSFKSINVTELIKKNSIFANKCKLCELSKQKTEIQSIGRCGHEFCLECLQRYCQYKINVMQTVICPQQKCNEQLLQNSKAFQNLPQNIKNKYTKNKLWKQTISNPHLRLCPDQNCHQGLIDISQLHHICRKCKRQYCKECQMLKHDSPCDKNFQQNFKQWKRCPNCSMFIQRSQGCNHMTCRCGNQFCFVCLSGWNQQHYQCGQDLQNTFIYNNNQIQMMPIWKRRLYFMGLILVFPILLCILIIVLIILWALAFVVGIVCGPCIIQMSVFREAVGIFCFILYPLKIVASIILVFIGGCIQFFKLLHQSISNYCRFANRYLSTVEHQNVNPQFFVEQLNI